MSSPFIGEIKMFGGNFVIRRFAFCNGQIMAISQNTALFSLLGTNYGGNGTSTFGLPNLQGRAPLHRGQGPGLSNYSLGEIGGSASVALGSTQLPAHTHTAQGDVAGGAATAPANGAIWSSVPRGHPAPYAAGSPNTTMTPAAIAPAGSGQPHNNLSPYLVINFIICLSGIYPSRT